MYIQYISKDRKLGEGGGEEGAENKAVGINNARQLTRTFTKEQILIIVHCKYRYEVSMTTHCYLGTGVMGCTVLHKDMTKWPRLCLQL